MTVTLLLRDTVGYHSVTITEETQETQEFEENIWTQRESLAKLLNATQTIETNDTDEECGRTIILELDFMEALTKIVEMMSSKLDEPQVCRIPLTNMTSSLSRLFPSSFLASMMKF